MVTASLDLRSAYLMLHSENEDIMLKLPMPWLCLQCPPIGTNKGKTALTPNKLALHISNARSMTRRPSLFSHSPEPSSAPCPVSYEARASTWLISPRRRLRFHPGPSPSRPQTHFLARIRWHCSLLVEGYRVRRKNHGLKLDSLWTYD